MLPPPLLHPHTLTCVIGMPVFLPTAAPTLSPEEASGNTVDKGERQRRKAEEKGGGERRRRKAEEKGRGEKRRRKAEEKGGGEKGRKEQEKGGERQRRKAEEKGN